MKVREIIEKLSHLDPDALVFAEHQKVNERVPCFNNFAHSTNILDIWVKHPKVVYFIVENDRNYDE